VNKKRQLEFFDKPPSPADTDSIINFFIKSRPFFATIIVE